MRDAVPDDMTVLRNVYRRSSLSNQHDRVHLLAHPDALELSDTSVREGRTRVAVVAGGRIVGFATFLPRQDSIELDDLFVDPDWMGQGIGRALVTDMVAIARTRGVQRIEVTANPHALGFYEKAGFVFDHDVETRFGSAPRMHLESQ
jgi:GNAT superfamily N-acetyltransferase